MLYCCETCSKKFTTEKQALDCERVHEEEKVKREEFAKEKEERIKDIQDTIKFLESKIEKYHKDYFEYPKIQSKSGNPSPSLIDNLWWHFIM